MMQKFSNQLVVILAVSCLTPLVNANGFILRPIALSGEQAAGQPPGVEFGDLLDTRVAISPNGDLLFRNELVGAEVTTTNDEALFREFSAGGQQAVVRIGDSAPEFGIGATVGLIIPASSSFQIPNFAISNTSELYVINPVGPSLPGFLAGLVRRTNSTTQVIAQTLQPVPNGNPNEIFGNNFTYPRINGQDHVAFLADTNERFSLFRTNLNDEVETIFSSGDQAPGLPSGIALDISSLLISRFDFANDGSIAMRTDLSGSGVNVTNDEAIVSTNGNALNLIVRKGDQAPGFDPGVTLQTIGEPSVNDNGLIAYRAELNPLNLGQAILLFDRRTNETLELIRVGAAISGDRHGEVLENITDAPIVLANNNAAIFRGFVDDPALLRVSSEDGLELLARRGDQAPGLPTGVTLNSTTMLYKANSLGAVAFQSNLANLSQGATGLFANSIGGESLLIAATGQAIDLNDDPLIDDLRVISAVGGFFDLADSNELVFALRFEDGSSGIFRTNIADPAVRCLRGDVDDNGTVSIDDIAPLVSILLDPGSATENEQCAADINEDSGINGLDLQGFVVELLTP